MTSISRSRDGEPARSGSTTSRFALGRAEEFASPERFDAIVSSYLAKYADLEALVGRARTLLEPGGRLVTHDFTYPSNLQAERLWRLQFRVIQSVCGLLWPAWRSAFAGLQS